MLRELGEKNVWSAWYLAAAMLVQENSVCGHANFALNNFQFTSLYV